MAGKVPGIESIPATPDSNTWSGLASALGPTVKSGLIDYAKDKVGDRYGNVGKAGVDLLTGGTEAFAGNLGNLGGQLLTPAIDKFLGKNKKVKKLLGKIFGEEATDTFFRDMLARPDPQLLFEYRVIMPAITGDNENFPSCPALPNEYVEDVDFPLESIETGSELMVNQRTVHMPGKIAIGDLTIKFYGEHSQKVIHYLECWKNSVRTPKGVYNLPYNSNGGGYMKPITVQLLANGVPVLALTAIGCFPTSRSAVSLGNASSDRFIPDQTFSVNGVSLDFDPQSSNGARKNPFGQSIGGKIAGVVGAKISDLSKNIFK